MKSYVFIAMVICSIIIYPFEAKSQDSGDLRIKSVTLVDGTVISAQNYAATDAAATDFVTSFLSVVTKLWTAIDSCDLILSMINLKIETDVTISNG